MKIYQKALIVFLRLALGWLFLYSGLEKVMDPAWSSAGFLQHAGTFSGFYHWLASPAMIGLTNFLNEWGQLLLGISLILGVFVRLSTFLGALLMIMYYFAALKFPYPDANSFIVDEHMIYAITLLVLGSLDAGKVFGLENSIANLLRFKKA